ncbi:MAG: hypothetical protein H6Q73_932 [Firmicutes bacterium]|nr:hypothetical protein [Bacillota bacterium]
MGAIISPIISPIRSAIISPLGSSSGSNNTYVGSVIDTSLFTFSRASTAYLGSLLYASGVARTGTDSTWGQYIEVEESTTNLLTANQAKVISGWGASGSSSSLTITYDTTNGGMTMTANETLTAEAYLNGSFSIGSVETKYTYGITAEVLTDENSSVHPYIYLYFYNGSTYTSSAKTFNTSGRKTVTVTSPSVIAANFARVTFPKGIISGTSYTFTLAQVEQKAAPTSWITGAATRAAEVLYAPNQYISATKGTIAARFSVDSLTGSIQMIADPADISNTGLALYINVSGYLEASYGSGSAQVTVTSSLAVTADTVYDAFLTWSSSGVTLYCCASAAGTVYTATSSTAPGISLPTNIYFGSNQGTQYFLNGKLYNVVGLGRALSSTEVAALAGTSWGVNLI